MRRSNTPATIAAGWMRRFLPSWWYGSGSPLRRPIVAEPIADPARQTARAVTPMCPCALPRASSTVASTPCARVPPGVVEMRSTRTSLQTFAPAVTAWGTSTLRALSFAS
jgi:hypothetical protein